MNKFLYNWMSPTSTFASCKLNCFPIFGLHPVAVSQCWECKFECLMYFLYLKEWFNNNSTYFKGIQVGWHEQKLRPNWKNPTDWIKIYYWLSFTELKFKINSTKQLLRSIFRQLLLANRSFNCKIFFQEQYTIVKR